MQCLSGFLAAAYLSVSIVGSSAQAQSLSVIEQARSLRASNQHLRSAEILIPWLSDHPADADAWLEYGYSQTALGNYDSARRSFARVLQISPDYADAELGLARIDFYEGDHEAAVSRLARLEPTRETHALNEQILAARAAQPAGRIRLDLIVEQSRLDNNLPDWTAAAASLSVKLSPDTALGGTIEHTKRFEREDVYAQAQVDRTLSSRWNSYAGLGGAIDADYRPRAMLFAGSEYRLLVPSSGSAGLSATIHSSFAEYVSGSVSSFSPGLTATFKNDAVRMGARFIVLRDETGNLRYGKSIDAGLDLTTQLGLRASWSDAPETSEGRTFDVEAASFSIRWPLTDRIGAGIGAVQEERSAYDRTAVSVSLSRSFQ